MVHSTEAKTGANIIVWEKEQYSNLGSVIVCVDSITLKMVPTSSLTAFVYTWCLSQELMQCKFSTCFIAGDKELSGRAVELTFDTIVLVITIQSVF